MSKKTLITIGVVILVILGLWWFFSLFSGVQTNKDGQPKSILGSLFPFGASTTSPNTNAPAETGRTEDTPVTGITKAYDSLVQVTNKRVAGFTTFALPTEKPKIIHDIRTLDGTMPTEDIVTKLPALRFMEQGTGFVYDTEVRGANTHKITETTIPQALIALFDDTGTNVLVRLIKSNGETVATYLGAITNGTGNSTGVITGDFLPENIPDVTASPDKKSFAYLMPTSTGVAGMTMKADGTAKKQIFSSSFSEWLLGWTSKGLTLTTKASATVSGYTYTVTPAGILSRILAPKRGLTTNMSPDGKTILYSFSGSSSVALHIYHTKDGSDVDTGLHTLPEKCAWAADMITAYCGAPEVVSIATYPDDWYQGLLNFKDSIWKINTTTNTTSEINNGEGNVLDTTNPALDQSGRYFLFINKVDSSLWSLDLTHQTH